jgi:hypothetical protein
MGCAVAAYDAVDREQVAVAVEVREPSGDHQLHVDVLEHRLRVGRQLL